MKIGLIGSTGLVGSRVVELLKDSYEITEFNSSTGTDISNFDSLQAVAEDTSEWIVLLAAKADVDGCELDKPLGEQGDAWKINVTGSQNVAKICQQTGKKLIYISTDFVFDGSKTDGEVYSETDTPNPVNWYAHTKLKGEQAVEESGVDHVILRLAYPYRAKLETKKDFLHAIKSRLESGQPIMGVTDHLFTPTFIDDFAIALDTVITQNVRGIYHIVGNQYLTPYEAAQMIAQTFDLNSELISSTTRAEYFQGKATRPFNLSLNNDKISSLGVRMKSFEEGLQSVKEQLENSKS